jgi:hypothetical protein
LTVTPLLSFLKKNSFLIQLILLIVTNYLVTKYFYHALPNISLYDNSSIFLNLFNALSISFSLLLLIPLLLYKQQWKSIFNNYQIIKYFVIFITILWAWYVITLDFNLYFNQAYHADRVILLILLLLSIRFPFFFLYFLIFSLLFINQLNYPSLEFSFPEDYNNPRPLLDILILFSTFILIKKFYKNFSILLFFITVICLHASNYFIPGLGKMMISHNYINWIWINDLSNIVIARYTHGWITDIISLDTALTIAKHFQEWTVIAQIITFLSQILVLVVFIHKRFSLLLFLSFELLHIGVFIVTGIFFWEWVLINLAIVYSINKLTLQDSKKIFNYKVMLVAIPFIFLGNSVFNASFLAWYDTPLHNYFEIYAVDENDKEYKMDKNLFAPYEQVLYASNYTSYIDKKTMTAWSCSNQTIMQELTAISMQKNKSQIKKSISNLEEKYGYNYFNQEQQKLFETFIKRYIQNLNKNQSKKLFWNYLTPFKHIYYSLNWDKNINNLPKIKYINIKFYKKFYNHSNNSLMTLEEKNLCSIKI